MIVSNKAINRRFNEKTECKKTKTLLSNPKIVCLIGSVGLVLLLSINVVSNLSTHLNIYFLDVGQGDCTVILYNRHCYVIDGGGVYYSEERDNIGKTVIIPFLLKKNVRHIDAIFITHFHYDHVKGVIELLEEFSVRNVIISDRHREKEENNQSSMNSDDQEAMLYEKIRAITREKNIPLIRMKEFDTLVDDQLVIECVYPSLERKNSSYSHSDENNDSLVLLIKNESFKLLLTGDIEKSAEREIAQAWSLDEPIHVLKIAHHGSKTSSSSEFIDTLQPDCGIISVGKNSFGHPHEETIKEFLFRNIPVYSTLHCGMIEIDVKKNYYSMKAFKGELVDETIKRTYKAAGF